MPSPFDSHSFTTRELMFSACLHLFDCVRHCMHQFVLSPHGPYFVSHLMAFCFYIKLAAGAGVRWWVLRFFWVWYCSTYRVRGADDDHRLSSGLHRCRLQVRAWLTKKICLGSGSCSACLPAWQKRGTKVPLKHMYVIAMPGASRSGVFIKPCHKVVS